MADLDERVDDHRAKALPELALFSVSLVFILLFMYLNVYALPLGTTSPEGAVDNASALYGLNIGIGGEILLTTDREFEVVDPSASGSLSAVWNGGGSLPLNGTMVVAEGFIIASPGGPVLMCESVTPLKATDTIFDNPWSLPSLRLLIIVLLWFSVTTVVAGLAALASHFRPNPLSGDRASALTEVCALSGLASFVCLVLIGILEPGLGGGVGIPTIALLVGFLLLLVSVAMHRTERHDVVEMSGALPIAAAVMVIIGILMITVQQQLLSSDLLGTVLTEFLPGFFIAAVVGTTGLILMGAYLEERRYYAISIKGLLKLGKDEVR